MSNQPNLFENFPLSAELLRAVSDMNYTETTDIQAGAIPLIMEGRDIIGRSSTGTGKTAAFGIPAVEMVISKEKYPQVLVLSPTRELAMQIAGEIRKYSKYKEGVSLAIVYGGQSMELQIRQLRTANIVIGTPGRIMDHMRRRTLHLDRLKMVVLDEADEMLNMGFYEDIQTILKETPETRQTVLFSATMPPAIMKITHEFLRDPEIIAVDKGQRTLDTITQQYFQVPQARKTDALNLLLQYYDPARCIVFCNTKAMVDELVDYLNGHSFKCIGLHGDMKQMMRTRVMQDFKTGRTPVLVATDVAARGIDVENVDAVINFDIPQEMEYYIHRIGRTGRAGKTGVSYTLACNRMQVRRIKEIEAFVKSPIEEKPIPSAKEILQRRQDALADSVVAALNEGKGGSWSAAADALLAKGHDAREIICALLGMIADKEVQLVPSIEPIAPLRSEQTPRGSSRVYLKLRAGRNQRITPNVVVGAITGETGLTHAAVGKIDIRSEETFVEMTADNAALAAEKMQECKIRNMPAQPEVVTGKPFAASSQAGARDYRSLPRKNAKSPTSSRHVRSRDFKKQ